MNLSRTNLTNSSESLALSENHVLRKKRIPYEVFRGVTPSVSHLRIFGAEAEVKVHSPANNLSPRTESCILLGFCEEQNTSVMVSRKSQNHTVCKFWHQRRQSYSMETNSKRWSSHVGRNRFGTRLVHWGGGRKDHAKWSEPSYTSRTIRRTRHPKTPCKRGQRRSNRRHHP